MSEILIVQENSKVQIEITPSTDHLSEINIKYNDKIFKMHPFFVLLQRKIFLKIQKG